MSDDRFTREADEDETGPPEPAHQVYRMAAVRLEWDGVRWLMPELPELEWEPDLFCNGGLHADSRVDRERCDIEKERARAAAAPSQRAVADAFDRAAANPHRTFAPVQGQA